MASLKAEEQTSAEKYPSRGLSPAGGAHDEHANGQPVAAAPNPTIPLEEDIMQLARLGQIAAIQKLFDQGKFDANYKDDQGITPLHWGAIKNHYALCHFLIQSGANVNAAGGDLHATPVLWAARSCSYYVVNLLLQHGADPLRTDNQGFNLLQNAALDGNVFQILVLLYQDIPVDTPDNQGHTSLMWAAYKGFPACLEALLRFDASVSMTDEQGFTALHWALVKGNQECIQKLIEYGSDRFKASNDGKTPLTVAREMSSKRQWFRALSNCGYDNAGLLKKFPLASLVQDRQTFISRLHFFWAFLVVFCGLYIVSGMPIYAGLPIAFFVTMGMQYVVSSNFILQWNPPNKRFLSHTSYLAGIFAGSLFWVGVRWITKILPNTIRIAPFSNLLFGIFYCLCAYFYILSMLEDPGWIMKPSSRTQQKAIVQELVDSEEFDEPTFCTICLIRRPLRSRHCKRCGRCVAKQDHHCPWINNCVAVNNHRHFFLYILNMELAVILLVSLVWSYLSILPTPEVTSCNIISDNLCTIYNKDSFTIVLLLWAMLQLTWVTMLIFTQTLQVARAQTTIEIMKGHNHLSTTAATVTSAIVGGSGSADDVGLTERTLANDSSHPPKSQPRKQGCLESWKRLLGVDTFMATAMYGSDSLEARRERPPFSRGVVSNFKDFFLDPAPLFRRRENGMAMLGGQRVDYTRLYDMPSRANMRSDQDDAQETGLLHGGDSS